MERLGVWPDFNFLEPQKQTNKQTSQKQTNKQTSDSD